MSDSKHLWLKHPVTVLGSLIVGYFIQWLFLPAGVPTNGQSIFHSSLTLFTAARWAPAWVFVLFPVALIYAGYCWGSKLRFKTENIKTHCAHKLTENQNVIVNYFKNINNQGEYLEDISKAIGWQEIEAEHVLNELEELGIVHCSYNAMYPTIYKLTKNGIAYAMQSISKS